MSTSAKSVRFDDNSMWVDLSDGRIIAGPLAWFPRLLHAPARAAPGCGNQFKRIALG